MAHLRTLQARQSFPYRLRMRAEREGLYALVHEVVREHGQALAARLDDGWHVSNWGGQYSLWRHVPDATRQVTSDVELRVTCALIDDGDDDAEVALDPRALPDWLPLTFTVEQTERIAFPDEPAGFGVVLTLLSMPAIAGIWWLVGGPLGAWQFFSWLSFLVVCVWAESRARELLEAVRQRRTRPPSRLWAWPVHYMVLQALFALLWMGVSLGAGVGAHRVLGHGFAIPIGQGLGFWASVWLMRSLRNTSPTQVIEREPTDAYLAAVNELEAYLDDVRVHLERAT